ncbi:hypothetical protein NEF87_002844 [Candidatus Lokiarchaeum ossiferum]|uniref:PD-(D/E)XK endonuclease-like domain-containing protein n=1 Tax=Candidatus Lokiarchaeum ossiferum TaxID=2951803 RepID=A0ABY6HVS4_9ARCH|nr:hypothetical protein NEF87_002844 [Candidatus Lokiarchaeum sp. B-35]
MVSVEKRQFIHNRIEYLMEWITARHKHPLISHRFGSRLLTYYNYVCTKEYPDHIFNGSEYLRCSSFRLKGLQKDARKKIGIKLINSKQIHLVDEKNQLSYISPEIQKLPKMAKIWFDIFSSTMDKNPGHGPVLDKILQLNKNALAVEVPIWTTTDRALINQDLQLTPYTCMSNEIFTGHIDLLLFDETDGSLVIADYKPENYLLRSLPQVATYGLVMKRVLKIRNVKCVSFSKEKAWVYDPEIVRTSIPQYLLQYGNPNLSWRSVLPSI